MTSSAEDLLRTIREDEKRIKALREEASTIILQNATNREAIMKAIYRMSKSYEILITKHIEHCDDNTFRQLWKSCFYKQIEDYRQALKQIKAAADDAAGKGARVASTPNFKQLLAMTQSMLNEFLGKGKEYFLKLMKKLESAANATSLQDIDRLNLLTQFVHKCLIYLGDLTRYKELYSTKEEKTYGDSLQFYEKAAQLMPDIGNAQNQLAVLATYLGAESTALYHYCRSIMVKSPFSGGFANIAQLFESNLVNYEYFQQLRAKGIDFSSPQGESLRFKMFLSNFVHLQGIYFAWSVRMHLEYLHQSAGSSQQSTATDATTMLSKLNDTLAARILRNDRRLKIEKLQKLSAVLLEDFDALLNDNKISNLHLIRIVSICIFSAHFAEMPDANLLSSVDGSFSQFLQATYDSQVTTTEIAPVDDSTRTVERTIVQSQVLTLLFNLVNKAALKIAPLSADADAKHGHDRAVTLALVCLLWLEQHPSHMLPSEEVVEDVALPAVFSDSLSMEDNTVPNQAWKRKYCVNKEQGSHEMYQRNLLVSSLCQMQDRLDILYPRLAESSPPRQKDPSVRMMLRDIAEIRGFLPLAEVVEPYFADYYPLKQTIKWYAVGVGRAETCRIVYNSINKLLPKRKDAKSEMNNVASAVRPRQLFDPHADSKQKSMRGSSSKNDGLSQSSKASQPRGKDNIKAAKSRRDEGMEKKRVKLHEHQSRDATAEDDDDGQDEDTEVPQDSIADEGESAEVHDASFSASNYSFFDNAHANDEKEGMWDYCLEEDAAAEQDTGVKPMKEATHNLAGEEEETNMQQMNTSVSSEVLPSLTEHIFRQSVSQGSLSGHASRDHLASLLPMATSSPQHSTNMSPAVSFSQFPRVEQPFHVPSMQEATRKEDEDDEDEFEDIVFRPMFPLSSAGMQTANSGMAGILSTPASSAQKDDVEDSLLAHRNKDIWAQFGVDSNASLLLPSGSDGGSLFPLSMPGAAGLSELKNVAGGRDFAVDWDSDSLLLGHSSAAISGAMVAAGRFDVNSFSNPSQDIFSSLPIPQPLSDWGNILDTAGFGGMGTGLSATSHVAEAPRPASVPGPPPGLFRGSTASPGVGQTTATASDVVLPKKGPPGLPFGGAAADAPPPGLPRGSQKN